MKKLLLSVLLIAEALLLCAADSPPLSDDMLKKLSAAGEKHVDEEIKRALLGVKQVREMMQKKEEKHRHLMDSLTHSSQKTKGALQLASETEQKLGEAEQHCQDITKANFEKCRPCLEDACKSYYTSTCRRGFTSFSLKVEEFFRKLATQLEASDQVYNQNEEDADPAYLEEKQPTEEAQLLQADASFGQLLWNISLMYNRSVFLVKEMQGALGPSFLAAFTAELQPALLSTMQGDQGVGPFTILDSVYDFGRNVLEEFSSVVADVFEEVEEAEEYFQQAGRDTGLLSAFGQSQSRHLCKRLRREAAECWQLQDICEACEDYLFKECPSVQQLHLQMEEMHMLLNASRQQFQDRLQLVQKHSADTQKWLSSMHAKYGWVSELINSTAGPRNIFSVITVTPQQQMVNNAPKPADSSVVVTILDSVPVAISVPAGLEVDDPLFIQYVVQEALTLRKQIQGMQQPE